MSFAKTRSVRVGKVPKHRETDWLQSTLKDDGDIRNVLSPRVELSPNLLTIVKENRKKTFGTLHLTNIPIHTATWCVFARDCMWASFQMRRIVETYTRGCQNSSFTNTQDILNIMNGSKAKIHSARRRSIVRRRHGR